MPYNSFCIRWVKIESQTSEEFFVSSIDPQRRKEKNLKINHLNCKNFMNQFVEVEGDLPRVFITDRFVGVRSILFLFIFSREEIIIRLFLKASFFSTQTSCSLIASKVRSTILLQVFC